jgi:branched-chain amino acid transport system permease protein
LGLAYIIEEIVKWFWGNQPLHVEVPAMLSGSIQFLGITYPTYRLFILLISVAVFAVLFIILYKTRAGIIVTAAVSRSEMVNALGINVPLVFMLLFGVGGALAGLAGVIGGPYLITNPGMAGTIIIDLFVVVVVGGLGSLPGALLASFLIGELQSFGILFVPQMAIALEFLLMAVVLIVKPKACWEKKPDAPISFHVAADPFDHRIASDIAKARFRVSVKSGHHDDDLFDFCSELQHAVWDRAVCFLLVMRRTSVLAPMLP